MRRRICAGPAGPALRGAGFVLWTRPSRHARGRSRFVNNAFTQRRLAGPAKSW